MKKEAKKPLNSQKTAVLGRPTVANPRKHKLPVRFSREELEWLRGEADKRGESLTDHARKRLGLALTGYGEAK